MNITQRERDVLELYEAAQKRHETHTKDWCAEAKSCFDMAAGYQWSDEDRAHIEDEVGKKAITYNRVDPFLDAVVGLEILNRQEVRYIPRTQDDTGLNETLTGAAEWVRDLCDAEIEESEAFKDTLICGMGWTGTRLDLDTDEEGQIIIERIDPMEMGWDSSAVKKNLNDSKCRWRKRSTTMAEIAERWPDMAPYVAIDLNYPEYIGEGHLASEAWKYKNDQGGVQDKHNDPKLIDFQWYEDGKVYKVATPAGVKQFSAERWKKVKVMVEQAGYPWTSVRKRVYKRAYICGRTVMEIVDNPSQKGFTYQCLTGKRDRKQGSWYGIVRAMRHPQEWANKFFSQILFEIVTNGKGIVAEVDAFESKKQAEESWARNDAITWASEGAIVNGKIMPKTASPYPQGMDRLMEFSISAFREVTGIPMELLGLTEKVQPGIVEAQRRQAGVTILAWAFDSLRMYRKNHGRLLAEFITEYISDGRLARIVGEEGAKYVPLVKNELSFAYDVIVEEAPSSPNTKERTWGVLQTLLPVIARMEGVQVPWAEIIKYSPLPEALTEKLQPPKPDPQQQQQQAQEQQMMKQLQMRNMVADVTEREMAVNETKFNAELKKQQARKTAAETGAVMGGG